MRRPLRLSPMVAVLALLGACGSFEDAPATSSGGPDASTTDAGDRPDSSASDDGSTKTDGGTTGPRVLATSSAPVRWLALDATKVIWMTGEEQGGANGVVRACAKTDCPSIINVKDDAPVGYLASDGQTAFISHAFGNQGIDRVEPNGTTTKIIPSKNTVYAMVVRDDTLFYAAWYDADQTSKSRALYKYALLIGSVEPIGNYVTNGPNTAAFVVTKDHAYLGAHNVGSIVSCKLASCTSFPEFRSNFDAFAYSMASDDVKLFWVNDVALMSCAAGDTCSSPTTELTAGDVGAKPRTVVHHSGKLFVQTDGGDLFECAASDCKGTKKKIAHDDELLVAIDATKNVAVDADAVYYVAKVSNEYRVIRLPRTK